MNTPGLKRAAAKHGRAQRGTRELGLSMTGSRRTSLAAAGLLAFCTAFACTSADRTFGDASTGGSDAGAGGTPRTSEDTAAGAAGEDSSSGSGGAPSDSCLGIVCETPPAGSCESATKFKTFDKMGSCLAGVCSYRAQEIACQCQGEACTTDPCVGLTCDTPPAPRCKDTNTQTEFASTGTCNQGSCSYLATDTGCEKNQLCSGEGCTVCATDASCGDDCTACGGNTPKCKDLGVASQCVGCLADADCSSGVKCDTTTNACEIPTSCVGLASTCGPSGSASCCASSLVPGGTFNRGNDAKHPATLSDFRLDRYEITVGRFKKFVAAYSPDMIAEGAGKNTNNPSDTGWDTAWNASMQTNPTTLAAALKCNLTYQTWTAGNDNLPINCINWYEAEAFCIWDGGRLPTEAEWNYAAVGGKQQRLYPWGSKSADCSFANYFGAAAGTDYCVLPGTGAVNAVGSESPKGDGAFGQADLAGNVWEWTQDWSTSPYPDPCDDCANLQPASYRALRGAGFPDAASYLPSSYRGGGTPDHRYYYAGARCTHAQ